LDIVAYLTYDVHHIRSYPQSYPQPRGDVRFALFMVWGTSHATRRGRT